MAEILVTAVHNYSGLPAQRNENRDKRVSRNQKRRTGEGLQVQYTIFILVMECRSTHHTLTRD